MGATNVFTYSLSGESLSISGNQNVLRLSVLCKAGSVSFLGSSTFNGLSSTPNVFAAGAGITVTAASPNNPLDGIMIEAATLADTAEIVISYQ